MKIRILLAAASLGLAAQAHGEVAREVASWTPATLDKTLSTMPAGDVNRGRQVHQNQFCASCHGVEGVAPTRNWPSVAGQRAEYTYKMLKDYKDERRNEDGRADPMVALARQMSEQEMADVAAYYASLPLGARNSEPMTPLQHTLVRKGDPARLLTSCAACHGLKGQGGKNESPALAGQPYEYLVRTLENYRNGLRANDVHHGMGQFAMPLTDAEIDAVARYYAR